jgi:hypothetical protein
MGGAPGRAPQFAHDQDRGQSDGSRHSDYEAGSEGVSYEPSFGLAAVQTCAFSSRQAECAIPAEGVPTWRWASRRQWIGSHLRLSADRGVLATVAESEAS